MAFRQTSLNLPETLHLKLIHHLLNVQEYHTQLSFTWHWNCCQCGKTWTCSSFIA